MRVLVKLLGFGFWLLYLNFARCQECLRENMKYENTEPVVKASYADGETVKVNCMTGYTGLYRLKCEKGEWAKSIERPCAKRKCGHPGDTPNGDFKLMEGTEFVFGATVVYTCKKGYEMTSRISQRTCRAQGWDNTVPLCEVVKCPAIHTNGDVTASGNTEEGSYGDVIHFECVSSDKKIDGSSDIHCEETGKWSDVVPKCKEITCTAPDISNGYVVEPRPKYQKDAILKYECYKRFKPRVGTPRCAKIGWTLNPECDEVTCELKSTTFGVKKTNPYGKTIFRAGESVEITCSEKYWFFFTKETSKSFTCRDDGQWDYEPVCEEITCEDPRDQHVYKPYWGNLKWGAKQSYRCEFGYRETAAEATCTRDGWTPKPLCTEIMCDLPRIPNAEIVGNQKSNYKINSRIQYKCRAGFKPEQPIQITCDFQGQWTGIQQCTEITCEVPRNQHVSSLEYYFSGDLKLGAKQSYQCESGYREMAEEATCTRYGWTPKPLCTEIRCEDPRDQHVYGTYWENLKLGEKQSYRCEFGYRKTAAEATCTRDGWTPKPLCTEIMCEQPKLPNAEIVGFQKSNYKINSRIQYECHPGFKPEEPLEITCDSQGQWTNMQQCTEIACEYPRDQHVYRQYFWGNLKLGEKQSYRCESGYHETAVEATCTRDGWTPKPLCTEIRCEDPRDQHVYGTYWENLKLGEKQSYRCEFGYRKMAEEATCTRDGWKPKPLCTEIICEPPKIPNAEIVESQATNYKVVSRIQYKCHPGFEPEQPVQITCDSQGQWTSIQQCTAKCGPPPNISNANIKEMTKNEYSTGERVEYICFSNDTLDLRPPFSRYLTCQQGEWKGNTYCLNPCIVTVEEMDERGIQLKLKGKEKIILPHDDSIEFACQSDKKFKASNLPRQKCNDGVVHLPECE